ncbi:MAG: hypothetical protein ACJ76V_04365 [Thermoleophilaceae bacterium]
MGSGIAVSGTAALGGMQLLHRYAFAAQLCKGMHVLDLSEAPPAARSALAEAASGVAVPGSGDAGEFDAVVALDGLLDLERREKVFAELERRAAAGARVIAALDRSPAPSRIPRVEAAAGTEADAMAEKLPGALTLRQYLLEGSLIGNGADIERAGVPARLLQDGHLSEDAGAAIVVSGFEETAVRDAWASLSVSAAPVALTYLRSLERANAELLRANRELMAARLGNEGSAAASLLDARRRTADAERRLKEMEAIARGHEEMAHRVKGWYDAPRYHMVDRVRNAIRSVPGFARLIRFAWNLVSTRPETPELDAPLRRDDEQEERPDAAAQDAQASPDGDGEPQDTSHRLEE